jgi:hypothetical protein
VRCPYTPRNDDAESHTDRDLAGQPFRIIPMSVSRRRQIDAGGLWLTLADSPENEHVLFTQLWKRNSSKDVALAQTAVIGLRGEHAPTILRLQNP